MKERPILFSGEMVNAILDGRKTQTRRIVKPQPNANSQLTVRPGGTLQPPMWGQTLAGYIVGQNGIKELHETAPFKPWMSPYGKPGDRLWVRETWQVRDDKSYYTKADTKCHRTEHPQCAEIWNKTQPPEAFPQWISPIFMPRWASRITLEITGVRVERLQEITEADAIAEGITEALSEDTLSGGAVNPELPEHFTPYRHKFGFKFLWDQINGKRASWESNPWVWVVDFKRMNNGTN